MIRAWWLTAFIALEPVGEASANALEPVSFSAIPGWATSELDGAFAAFRRSCAEILETGNAFQRQVMYGGKRRHWREVCSAAATMDNSRRFFETHFVPMKVRDKRRPEGLFTGYYEPEVEGSFLPDALFNVPIYGKPADLVAFDGEQRGKTGLAYGRLVNHLPAPYASRKEIEKGALAGQGLELVWLKDWADAYFLHVQGSGRIRLADGTILRLVYAAKSGRPYTGIGTILVARGIISPEAMSMQAIRAWMRHHPEDARELMWKNESFIFFRAIEMPDATLGPIGAQHVQLTPERSLAVDRELWMFGTPVWLDTVAPAGPNGETRPFRQLLIAQDTGSAIKGLARGDVFWGTGEAAEIAAGHMKSAGQMIVLLPRGLAADMGLRP